MGKIEATVDRVVPGSIAGNLGIEKGDRIISINGYQPRDYIDYRFLCADEELEVEVMKKNDELWVCDIRKEYDEDLGVVFEEDTFDGIMSCVNKCIFCFVDQMPPEMRESLYVKDDDYRLSFMHGNFITLTNLTKKDFNRILGMKISPLYISVHCTNPGLRERLLGNRRAGKIMEDLVLLAGAGIEMHTQIVLCPDLNDGVELERTIRDLSSLWPQVKSIAIVPVGLTRRRQNLRMLRKISPAEAAALIDRVHDYQEEFIEKLGSPLVYLGDEFYVTAGKEFPEARYYDNFPQLENGVGMVRFFYDSFDKESQRLPVALPKPKKPVIVTGTSGARVLRPVTERLNKVKGLQVELVSVFNGFFGGYVTVAGLLTGEDIISALQNRADIETVLLPSVMCRRDEPVFLDGITPGELEKKLNVPVRIIDIDKGAKQLIDVILE